MAQTTPNMSLKTWDLLTDNFSHADLRANWLAVDQHDHTSGKGVQIGAGALANLAVSTSTIADQAVTATKIANLGVGTGQIADNAVTTGKLAAGAVTDTVLASPNNVTYKQIIPSVGLQNGDGTNVGTLTSGNTYLLAEGFTGSAVTQLPASFRAGASVFYIDPADYTVGAKTNKYRLRVSLLTNATAPTSTFTVGLYNVVTVAGASGSNTITIAAVTAGSTVAFANPPAAGGQQGNSGDFTAPVAGFYVVGCAITGASSVANATVVVRAILQHRQV